MRRRRADPAGAPGILLDEVGPRGVLGNGDGEVGVQADLREPCRCVAAGDGGVECVGHGGRAPGPNIVVTEAGSPSAA